LSFCPRCGTKIHKQIKTWSIIGRRNINGKQSKLWLGFFICPECEKKFLKILEKDNIGNIKDAVKEIKGIEKGLEHMLDDLKDKIEILKNERAELLEEIEQLKIEGEKKASTLEEEIGYLRGEIEDFKELLNENE
jgi:peptidoglycan hydrolase CwlO-like protein